MTDTRRTRRRRPRGRCRSRRQRGRASRWPGPGKSVLPARARSVPRLEEHVRRRGLRTRARRHHPELVGGGADPAMGDPPGHDDADRRPGADRRLPHRDVGPAALQRRHRLPTRLRPVARGQGGRRRRAARLLDHRHRPAPRRRARSSACAPTDPTATSPPTSSSRATASTRSSPRRPASTPTPSAEHYTVGVKETIALPQGGDRRAVRPPGHRRRRLRDHRLHRRRARAAGSSTPTSTRWRWASCCQLPALAAAGAAARGDHRRA